VTNRDLADADKERQLRRMHLQRAILDKRSQQASELARELLTSVRPRLTADTTTVQSALRDVKPEVTRRPASAHTERQTLPLWMQSDFKEQDAYQNTDDMENIRPKDDIDRPRPLSACGMPEIFT